MTSNFKPQVRSVEDYLLFPEQPSWLTLKTPKAEQQRGATNNKVHHDDDHLHVLNEDGNDDGSTAGQVNVNALAPG